MLQMLISTSLFFFLFFYLYIQLRISTYWELLLYMSILNIFDSRITCFQKVGDNVGNISVPANLMKQVCGYKVVQHNCVCSGYFSKDLRLID